MRTLTKAGAIASLVVLAGCGTKAASVSPAASSAGHSAVASASASLNAWEHSKAGIAAVNHAAHVIQACGAQTDTVTTFDWTTPPPQVSTVVVAPHLHFIKYSERFVSCFKRAYHGLGTRIGTCLKAAGIPFTVHIIKAEAPVLLTCGAKAQGGQS